MHKENELVVNDNIAVGESESPENSSVNQKTSEETAILYDKNASQCVALDIENDEEKYEMTQVYSGLPDDVLIEYDRLREVFLESEGKTTDLNTDSVAADEYLFEKLCIDVEGFDGEKPEDWHELIDYDEKKYGINKLLGVKIVSSNKEKQTKKRSWGQQISLNTVELKARFDDKKILSVKAHFDKKTPADIAAYGVIKNRVSLIERGLDESAIKIPASMKRKADLFDRIKPRTEGYVGEPPLHHKAAFITGFFEPRISAAEKK